MEAHELDNPNTDQTVIGLKTQMDLLDKVHIDVEIDRYTFRQTDRCSNRYRKMCI